jgi:hypothetical protein
MERLTFAALAAAQLSGAFEEIAPRRPSMKRLTLVAVAAALLATIAFAETPTRDAASAAAAPDQEYVPSVNFMTDGFASGAFTVPPS